MTSPAGASALYGLFRPVPKGSALGGKRLAAMDWGSTKVGSAGSRRSARQGQQAPSSSKLPAQFPVRCRVCLEETGGLNRQGLPRPCSNCLRAVTAHSPPKRRPEVKTAGLMLRKIVVCGGGRTSWLRSPCPGREPSRTTAPSMPGRMPDATLKFVRFQGSEVWSWHFE